MSCERIACSNRTVPVRSRTDDFIPSIALSAVLFAWCYLPTVAQGQRGTSHVCHSVSLVGGQTVTSLPVAHSHDQSSCECVFTAGLLFILCSPLALSLSDVRLSDPSMGTDTL